MHVSGDTSQLRNYEDADIKKHQCKTSKYIRSLNAALLAALCRILLLEIPRKQPARRRMPCGTATEGLPILRRLRVLLALTARRRSRSPRRSEGQVLHGLKERVGHITALPVAGRGLALVLLEHVLAVRLGLLLLEDVQLVHTRLPAQLHNEGHPLMHAMGERRPHGKASKWSAEPPPIPGGCHATRSP